jgi:hypothetical protein
LLIIRASVRSDWRSPVFSDHAQAQGIGRRIVEGDAKSAHNPAYAFRLIVPVFVFGDVPHSGHPTGRFFAVADSDDEFKFHLYSFMKTASN